MLATQAHTQRSTAPTSARGRRGCLLPGLLLTGMAVTVFVFLVIAPILLAAGHSSSCSGQADAAVQPGVSSVGVKDIPADYLRMYQQAGHQYGIPWNLLAGIGHIESHHGANPGPSSAGALGPMQFMPATWATWGVDGNHDGRKDIMDPADAIPAAARYLKASGAPGDLNDVRSVRKALWAYNQSSTYGDNVVWWAHTYGAGGYTVGPASSANCAAQADGLPTGGPFGQQVVAYAEHWLGTPYQWGGGDVNGPTYGSAAHGTQYRGFDCSGLVMYAIYQASGHKIALPHNSDTQSRMGHAVPRDYNAMQPGDTIGFDTDGSGGYDHIGIYIGGRKMVVAPHTGDVVKIQALQGFEAYTWAVRRFG